MLPLSWHLEQLSHEANGSTRPLGAFRSFASRSLTLCASLWRAAGLSFWARGGLFSAQLASDFSNLLLHLFFNFLFLYFDLLLELLRFRAGLLHRFFDVGYFRFAAFANF